MERGMTADQVLKAIWRRKLLVSVVAGAVFATGAAVVMTRPSIYTATAVVRVEPQRPGEEMVQRTVSDLIEQRLLTVRQELLARPVLQRAIEELGLYPELVEDNGIEAAVERMRKDLEVKVEGESAFELTYSAESAETAAKVANRLPQVYAEETLKLRQAQAARATQLFADEVESLKTSVADWERRIAQFKVDHIGELPEQLEMNMRGLERVGALMQTKSEELRVAEARRSDMARSQYAADSEAGRLSAAEQGLQRNLLAAKTTWTADHPEVQRIDKERVAVTAQRERAEQKLWAERQERARAAMLVTNVQKEITGLQKQAELYQKRLDRTPQWAHELSVLNRDYDISRTKYQSVVSRKVEAELAQDLEAKSATSLFNVISPAGVPSSPAKPDRMNGLLISLLLSLGLGLLTAVILEMRDDSLRAPHEVKERIPVPVLAVVPKLTMKSERRVLNAQRNTTRQELN